MRFQTAAASDLTRYTELEINTMWIPSKTLPWVHFICIYFLLLLLFFFYSRLCSSSLYTLSFYFSVSYTFVCARTKRGGMTFQFSFKHTAFDFVHTRIHADRAYKVKRFRGEERYGICPRHRAFKWRRRHLVTRPLFAINFSLWGQHLNQLMSPLWAVTFTFSNFNKVLGYDHRL
jgi:hypothetical protein